MPFPLAAINSVPLAQSADLPVDTLAATIPNLFLRRPAERTHTLIERLFLDGFANLATVRLPPELFSSPAVAPTSQKCCGSRLSAVGEFVPRLRNIIDRDDTGEQ